MIDIDVARRLRDAGLPWEPADGDHFAIDVEDLREQTFMLSSMVVERARDRVGDPVLRFNGTTEWALDSIEQQEAIWIPREDQLREALGDRLAALERETDGAWSVRLIADHEVKPVQIRAPRVEDAYAGALLILLTGPASPGPAREL